MSGNRPERAVKPASSPVFLRGAILSLVEILMRLNVLGIAVSTFSSPRDARRALRRFRSFYQDIRGAKADRMVVFRRKAYWGLHAPAWPGEAFNAFTKDMLLRLGSKDTSVRGLATMVLAITKKCPYDCEHCYAGKWRNTGDVLSLEDLRRMMRRFQENGVRQIQLSGGEPLLRSEDVIELLRASRGATSFQLLTTGYELSADLAVRLRAAGLCGVVLSLDHWDPARHNAFRRNNEAFSNVIQAAGNARCAGLMVSLSLCPTIEFLTCEENLWKYFDLARSLGTCFVRVLEPMQEGNYACRDVRLGPGEMQILDRFYLKANTDRAFRSYPVVIFPAYHNRRTGCFGAGQLFLDVDADGNVNPCPFRQIRAGNCLEEPLGAIIDRLQRTRCDCGYFPLYGT